MLKYRKTLNITLKSKLILLVGFLSSISLVFSPEYHRGTNIFFYYCILIFLITLLSIDEITDPMLKGRILLSQILLNLFLLGYIMPYQLKIYEYSVYLEEEILKQKAEQKGNIVVKQIDIKANRFINYMALWDDPSSKRNIMMARYYNIDQIQPIEKK